MILPPVLTKRDFVLRYKAEEFGNASPTWDTIADWRNDSLQSGPGRNGPQRYHFRNRIKGGPTYYDLTADQGVEKIPKLEGNINDWYVSAMAPTELTTIQGEVARTSEGLWLTFTHVKKPMRDALREQTSTAKGLTAKLILEAYLNVKSQEWLTRLLDSYPGHVVEFSCYSKCWGTVPGYNTVWWEVRAY